MTPNPLEPRRLREGSERPSSIEGRLARQLRLLSADASMPHLRSHAPSPHRRRHLRITVRTVAVATLVLAVSAAATAMATYVVHHVWRPSVEVTPASLPPPPAAKHRGKVRAPSQGYADLNGPPVVPPLAAQQPRTLTMPAAAQVRQTERPRLAASSATVPLSVGRPSTPAQAKSQWLVAQPDDGRATQPYLRSEEVAPSPARTVDPPAMPPPSLPLGAPPIGPTWTEPGRVAISQPRTDGVTQEAGLLRQALHALRREHDTTRSLALLDEYDRRFGHGALALEAMSARAQALLQLGDNARALQLLDRLPLRQEGQTGVLRVTRGELRSLSGRCRDALLDFEAVLASTGGNASADVARALFGRASCRARTGDSGGAEQDRQRYLKEFPQGPAIRQLSSPP